MAGIEVHIAAGTTAGSSSISATGSVQHVVTDAEAYAFWLNDAGLPKAVNAAMGHTPDNAYMHSPTPWNDLYTTYNWPQVQTVLSVVSATILEITSDPVIVAQQTFTNSSSVEGTFNVEISDQVANTAETNWSTTETVSISQSIDYTVGVVGGSTSLSFSAAFGQGGSNSSTVTVGAGQSVTVDLKPNQSVNAELTASKGVLKARIVYQAKLMGTVAVNYGTPYKGHHFWGLDVNGVLTAYGKPTAIQFTEDIEVGFFTNSSVVLTDPTGAKVTTYAATAATAPVLKATLVKASAPHLVTA